MILHKTRVAVLGDACTRRQSLGGDHDVSIACARKLSDVCLSTSHTKQTPVRADKKPFTYLVLTVPTAHHYIDATTWTDHQQQTPTRGPDRNTTLHVRRKHARKKTNKIRERAKQYKTNTQLPYEQNTHTHARPHQLHAHQHHTCEHAPNHAFLLP